MEKEKINIEQAMRIIAFSEDPHLLPCDYQRYKVEYPEEQGWTGVLEFKFPWNGLPQKPRYLGIKNEAIKECFIKKMTEAQYQILDALKRGRLQFSGKINGFAKIYNILPEGFPSGSDPNMLLVPQFSVHNQKLDCDIEFVWDSQNADVLMECVFDGLYSVAYKDVKFIEDDINALHTDIIQREGKMGALKTPKIEDWPYTTPYIEIIYETIKEANISEKNQPKVKAILVPMIEKKLKDRHILTSNGKVSNKLVTAMATIMRFPSSQKGRIRKQK